MDDLISVIIPVYKVEPYLRRCVDSVLAQTYTNLEVILVDDGSPDNCGAICDEYAEKDSRVKVIHQENAGLSEARNAGLNVIRGKFVSFVDSDDYVSPVFLERMKQVMEEENAEVVECGRIDVYADEKLICVQQCSDVSCYEQTAAFELLLTNSGFHQTVWNKLYKRPAIGNLRFPKGKIHEDEFFTWKVFRKINRAALISEKLYYYCHREGSIMEVFTPDRLNFLEARLERHQYVIERYPDMITQSKMEILLPCIYIVQKLLQKNTANTINYGNQLFDNTIIAFDYQRKKK